MSKVITVFGGSGFVGRALVQKLARDGWSVRVAVRRPAQARDLQPMGGVGQILAIPCRVTSADEVERALSGADAAVNLTGILFEKGAQRFDKIHHQAAGLIAQTAARLGVASFVQMSALGADEKSPSAYARSKAKGEQAVQEAFPNASIIRPSVIFGPGDGFFNRFAALARISPFLPLIAGGRTKFQPVHVGDVAEAIVRCLEKAEARGRIYELAGPGVYSFRELLELLLRQTGQKRFLVSLPAFLARIKAFFFEMMPVPPLTRDQISLLAKDNVLSGDQPGLTDLGIKPQSVEAILPHYIDCYRVGGRYPAALEDLNRR